MQASGNVQNESVMQKDNVVTNAQLEVVRDLEPVFEYFYFDENQNLKISLSDQELGKIYSNNEEGLQTVYSTLERAIPMPKENVKQSSSPFRLAVHSGKVWFHHQDVVATLYGAAVAGPAAVYAALTSLGTFTTGPVGGAVIAALGIIGLPGLNDFVYQILQASANGQGVYIGAEMNGAFPNIVSGTF